MGSSAITESPSGVLILRDSREGLITNAVRSIHGPDNVFLGSHTLGDVDGDGYDDAMLRTQPNTPLSQRVFYFRGGPQGLHRDPVSVVRTGVDHATMFGDIDGDGRDDLIAFPTWSRPPSATSIFLGTPGGLPSQATLEITFPR